MLYANVVSGACVMSAATVDPNEVSITIGTQKLSGWLGVRITRGIERFPSDFELVATEHYPTSLVDIDIVPGSPCVVSLGADTVITGYVDTYSPQIAERSHEIRIQGRSKCEDLVDCSAMFQTVQLNNLTLGGLATKLAQPFGVSVSLPDGDSGTVPQFTIVVTETPYEVIERAARWNAKLVYDDPNGNLVIASVGVDSMETGFQEGVNVQRASGMFSRAERMTEIAAISQTTSVLTNDVTVVTLPLVAVPEATDTTFPGRADGLARYRPLLILAEQDLLAQGDLMAVRVQWEMARRIGRSQAITITCDSWRDSLGELWAPNKLATVNMPSLKIQDIWLISEVTFSRDDEGTHADVTLMPPAAFIIGPNVLQPYYWQIAQNAPNAGNVG
jgi:prophage tail gpP-like protein